MKSLFGPAHLAWLAAIAIASATLAWLCRRHILAPRPLRLALALLIAACEIERYLHDGLSWPHGLPLQLCSITAWFAVFALLTLAPLAAEYTYFLGISGAGMAVLTPDLGSQWPPRFFVTHSVLIASACVLAFGRLVPLRPGAGRRAWLLFLVNTILMGIFDWATGANYWYLRGKPASFSLYRWLGPWPVYMLSVAVFAIFLFWVLWLPWRALSAEPLFLAQRLQGPAAQHAMGRQPARGDA